MTPEKRATMGAVLSLLLFAALMGLALWAFFERAESPWTWRSFVAAVSLSGAVTAAFAIARHPSRRTAGAGVTVMVFSLLRLLGQETWSAPTYAILALTSLLLIPVVHAAILLPVRAV